MIREQPRATGERTAIQTRVVGERESQCAKYHEDQYDTLYEVNKPHYRLKVDNIGWLALV